MSSSTTNTVFYYKYMLSTVSRYLHVSSNTVPPGASSRSCSGRGTALSGSAAPRTAPARSWPPYCLPRVETPIWSIGTAPRAVPPRNFLEDREQSAANTRQPIFTSECEFRNLHADKKIGTFFRRWLKRPTDRPTDRPTNRDPPRYTSKYTT